MHDSYRAPWGPGHYRYALKMRPVPLELDAEEAVGYLREEHYFHAHNHAFYKARSERLAAELAEARGALQHATGAPLAA